MCAGVHVCRCGGMEVRMCAGVEVGGVEVCMYEGMPRDLFGLCMMCTLCVCVCGYMRTSMALVSMRVSRKGIFSGNFSLVMATSKQSPKSMCRIRPVRRSNMRLEGCLKVTNQNTSIITSKTMLTLGHVCMSL